MFIMINNIEDNNRFFRTLKRYLSPIDFKILQYEGLGLGDVEYIIDILDRQRSILMVELSSGNKHLNHADNRFYREEYNDKMDLEDIEFCLDYLVKLRDEENEN